MAETDVRTLDVGQLNDAAAVLWDEAHGRGARAGAEKARLEFTEYHGGQMLELVAQMLEAATAAEGGEQWRLAHFAHRLLRRTPGSGSGAYEPALGLMERAVPSDGTVSGELLGRAADALDELRSGR